MTPTQLAETVPAQTLAKALLEAEAVLKSNLFGLEQVPDDAFGFAEDGSGDENGPNRWSIARELEDATSQALAQIGRIKKGEM